MLETLFIIYGILFYYLKIFFVELLRRLRHEI